MYTVTNCSFSVTKNKVFILEIYRDQIPFFVTHKIQSFYFRDILVLGRTWFGSEVCSFFWGSVGFFLILFSKVWGWVQFLGDLVGSWFGFLEQIGGLVGLRFDFWRLGRFEVQYFKVWPILGYTETNCPFSHYKIQRCYSRDF